MKIHKVIHFMLSLVLVIAIGFMEYSIIDDSFSTSHVSSQETIKKEKKSHELIIARNMHMDDDDEDAVIKYTPHEFYHCDLMLQSDLMAGSSAEPVYTDHYICGFVSKPILELSCNYRI